ncbi:hypothetical protein F4778DRAFT_789940 [Xylariomycetidae sp. FL2044]|nr:hypothetical protein F4778DRAFT_789940 [Xylariomycetidae sp. FL2044]
MAVTYKQSNEKSQEWNDMARGVWGDEDNNKVEYLAIRTAMGIGLTELKRTTDSKKGLEEKFPTIITLSDSEGSIRKIMRYCSSSYKEPVTSRDHWLDSALAPLRALSSLGAKVELHWIRGHAGNEGNSLPERIC